MTSPLVIDGSHGEGGGQILRSSVTFSTLSGRPIRIEKIRAGRSKPGLAAQHVTAIRAAAAICGATVAGDELASLTLAFTPRHPPQAGAYAFDVAAARPGGSAGAASLVLQTVLLPLAMADGASQVTVHGGTHMAWSPSVDYLQDVWLPAVRPMGVAAELELQTSGWFPIGKGCVRATVRGAGSRRLKHVALVERGALVGIGGRALAANLPAHIPSRMANRAIRLLDGLGVPLRIEPRVVRAACAGAGIFLVARYEHVNCGFTALGARGKPAEAVAEEAVVDLLAHWRSGAALDRYLGDQILAPLALADGPSVYAVETVSRHLRTNAWVLDRFGLARTTIDDADGGTGHIRVAPQERAV